MNQDQSDNQSSNSTDADEVIQAIQRAKRKVEPLESARQLRRDLGLRFPTSRVDQASKPHSKGQIPRGR